MSGLTPGVTLRNTFISASSPKATEELDCSPLNSVECASRSSSCPGSRWKRGGTGALDRGLGLWLVDFCLVVAFWHRRRRWRRTKGIDRGAVSVDASASEHGETESRPSPGEAAFALSTVCLARSALRLARGRL